MPIGADPTRALDRLPFVFAIDQIEADEPLLRLDERPVRHVVTCRAHPHCSSRAWLFEPCDGQKILLHRGLVLERSVPGESLFLVELGDGLRRRRRSVDQQGVSRHRREA